MLLAAIACGVMLGVLYDVLCLSRLWMRRQLPLAMVKLRERMALPQRLRFFAPRPHEQKKHGRVFAWIFIFLEDIIFCLVATLVMILLLYEANDGQFRLSALLVAALAFVLYRVTLGRLLMLLCGILITLLCCLARWFVAILAYPALALMRLLWRWTAVPRMRLQHFCSTQWSGVRHRCTSLWHQLTQRPHASPNGADEDEAVSNIQNKRLHVPRQPSGPHGFFKGQPYER